MAYSIPRQSADERPGGDPAAPRVLITGGAGFIGSHLTAALLARGHEVIAIDDLSTGSLENVERFRGVAGFRLVIDTIGNTTVLDGLVQEVDVVVHLAAAVGVQLVVEDALTTIETNVMGTGNVLEVAARHGVKVLVASTSEVYGKCAKLPAAEDDDVLLGASRHSRWSYAASKLVDEFLALAYHRQKGLPVVVFRLFNTVGPRQSGRYGMVIPRFASAALAGDPLPVHGDGGQSRSFLHVQDAVDGILALMDEPKAIGQVFNVGASDEISIGELARKVLRHAGREASDDGLVFIPYEVAYAAGYEDVRRRVADTSKLRAATGWRPRYSLDDILRDVVADLQGRAGTEDDPHRADVLLTS